MNGGPAHVILALDVEEEGLFGGAYRREVSVRNVASLERLVPLLDEFSLPVTLLCAHSVFSDAGACRALDALRRRGGVEIGAHLHHWNTPPLEGGSCGEAYLSPGALPRELFARRLETLLRAARVYSGCAPVSFRMGKWDLHRWHWPFLAEAGIRVDASVRPLHHGPAGRPDHFSAPADPYVVRVAGRRIIEAPLTVAPLCAGLPALARRAAGLLPPGAGAALKTSMQKWAALAVLPVYHPLWAMRRIAALHLARGGRFIMLAWHSSEMMPGGAPHMPDEAAVEIFMRKTRDFLAWLHEECSVKGLTLGDLAAPELAALMPEAPPVVDKNGDWQYD